MTRGIFIAVLALLTTGCSTLYAHLTYQFNQSEQDSRVYYENGAEDIATSVARRLADAIKDVEQAEYVKFKDVQAIKVYVFNSRKRYATFSNASIKSRGSSSTNGIYLSSKLRTTIESLPLILNHELSHVHLRQYTGTWQYITNITGWFNEGMAVVTSKGGGAERITEQRAIEALKQGHHFIPTESGSIFGHQYAHDYGLKPHMYYRQAGLFVRYLQQRDPRAFKKSYIGLTEGKSFTAVWQNNYGLTIDELWHDFVTAITTT
ncbi:MAG: hypothetical protein PVJ39_06055 [Gammaproteobacteria bacterium]|jgi:hypothetical protein